MLIVNIAILLIYATHFCPPSIGALDSGLFISKPAKIYLEDRAKTLILALYEEGLGLRPGETARPVDERLR